MVSVAPNLFRITGRVVSKKKDTEQPEWIVVTIRLKNVEHVKGPATFLDPSEKEIDVSMADDVAAGLKEGDQIECSVRKAPGHFFVIPDSVEKRSET